MGSEEYETVRFEDLRWLPPVRSVADLPSDVGEGATCFVQEEAAIYSFQAQKWSPMVTGGLKPAPR